MLRERASGTIRSARWKLFLPQPVSGTLAVALGMVVVAALALSVNLTRQRDSVRLAPFRLPTWLLGPMMGIAPKLLASVRVLLDSHSNMEELRSTCRDVLTEARRLGVNLPRLEAASSLFQTTGQEHHAGFADAVAQPACHSAS